MTSKVDFTDDQLAFISQPGSQYLSACPGAGKTQAIAERFAVRPGQHDRRGVALISFTRASASEAEDRCSAATSLLRAPNYVGTIDSFIHRFIVTPPFRVLQRSTPIFKDSWSAVHGTEFRIRGLPDVEFELDWFQCQPSGEAVLAANRAHPWQVKRRVEALNDGQRRTAEAVATAKFRGLLSAGVIDCSYARTLARNYMDDSGLGQELSRRLASRFYEVIVDEVQDCNPDDVEVLRFLQVSGIALVMVGDPDQSIYNFRGSSHEHLIPLLSAVPASEPLKANFRSSPAICSLNDSLRHGMSADVASGKHKNVSTPVYVFDAGTSFADHEDRILHLLDREEVAREDVVCLAHGEWIARELAGASPVAKPSASKLFQLARWSATLSEDVSSSERLVGLKGLQSSVRGLCSDESLRQGRDEAFFAGIGLSEREFNEGCVRLAVAVRPHVEDPAGFKKAFKDAAESLAWGRWLNVSAVRIPSGNRWPTPLSTTSSFRWSSIHKFKGLQAPAIVLAVPPAPKSSTSPSGLDLWGQGKSGDPRRVLYVGASRAEKLLIVLAHRDVFPTVRDIVRRDSVHASFSLPL